MHQERKSIYTNGIKSHSSGMADNFSGTQISSESWAECGGERETEEVIYKSLWFYGSPAGGDGYCHFPSWNHSVAFQGPLIHPWTWVLTGRKTLNVCEDTSTAVVSNWADSLRLTLSKLPSIQESYGIGQLVVGIRPDIYETSQLRRALYSRGHPESKISASRWISAEGIDHDRSVPWCKKNRFFPEPWEICSALWTGHHLPVICSVTHTRCSKKYFPFNLKYEWNNASC